MNKANAKAIHNLSRFFIGIAKSREKPTALPKLVNKYVFANADITS